MDGRSTTHGLSEISLGARRRSVFRQGCWSQSCGYSQLPSGKIIFGRWSDAIIGTWQAVELLVDPYARAHLAEVLISLTVYAAVAFRYSSAFVASSDSAIQLAWK